MGSDRQAVTGQQVSYILNIVCKKMLGGYYFIVFEKIILLLLCKLKVIARYLSLSTRRDFDSKL